MKNNLLIFVFFSITLACSPTQESSQTLFISTDQVSSIIHYYDQDLLDSLVYTYQIFQTQNYSLEKLNDSLKLRVWDSFGYGLIRTENYQEAYIAYKEALNLAEKILGTKHTKYGSVANNLAIINKRRERYKEAVYYYHLALKVNQSDAKKGSKYRNLGELYREISLYDSSIYAYQKALELLPEDRRHGSENNLGVLYISLRKLEQARIHLLKALDQRLETLKGTANEHKIAETYNNLAFIHLLEKDYTQSLDLLEKAIKIPHNSNRVYLRSLNQKIFCLIKLDRLQEASSLVWQADSLLIKQQESLLNPEDKLFFVENTDHFAELGFTIHYKLNDIANAFYFAERKKGNVLQELLAKVNPNLPNNKIKVASISDVQTSLREGTTLVEYNFANDSLYAFVITNSKYRLMRVSSDKLNDEIIDSLALDFRRAITSLDGKKYLKSSLQMYQSIFKPLEKEIGSQNKLIIIPDRNLYYVPFEAMISQAPKTQETMKPFFYSDLSYLLRDYTITYNTSATLAVTEIPSPRSFDKNFTGFAPSFAKSELEPLPTAQKATIFSSKLFKKVQMFTNNATKSNFIELIKKGINTQILHFDTHGIASEEYPDSTALAFEDSLIYLAELLELKRIGQNDLIVLSACSAGSGRYAPGEGIISLARGFTSLGARKLLYSLWLALEKPTAGLMSQFYIYVSKGLPYDEALKRAKLDVIASGVGHPRFWSNFILSENFTA